MNKEEILKEAIKKAVKNGWKEPFWFWHDANRIKYSPIGEIMNSYHQIIFDHSFCKAFAKYIYESKQWLKLNKDINWMKLPKDELMIDIEKLFKMELVLAEDRLEYIKKFL